MAITLRDIANAVDVSEATVSNALNHRGSMSEETRQRILDVANAMGYTPNRIARRLALSQNRAIGILVPNLENPFYGKLVRNIVARCDSMKYHVVISDSFDDSASEFKAVEYMISEQVEGLLIVPTNSAPSQKDYIRLLKQNSTPFCYLANRIPGEQYPFVMTNLTQGAYQLITTLLRTGRRDIWLLCGLDKNPTSRDRLIGYRQALEDFDLPYNNDHLISCSRFDYREGYESAAALLATGKKVDAIVSINDYMAVGVLMALIDAKRSIPDDIAVTGYDDMFFSQVAAVPLTTVRQNIDVICEKGIDILMGMIHGELDTNPQIFVEPELVLRQST